MPVPSPAEFKRLRRIAIFQVAVLIGLGLLTRVFEDALDWGAGMARVFLIFVAIGQFSFWRLAFSSHEEVVRAVEEVERKLRQNPPPPAPTSREVVRRWSLLTKVLIVMVFVPAGVLGLLGSFFIHESWGVTLFVALFGLAMLALPGALIWAHIGNEEPGADQGSGG